MGCIKGQLETEIYKFSSLWNISYPDLPTWNDVTFSPPGMMATDISDTVTAKNNVNKFYLKNLCIDPSYIPTTSKIRSYCIISPADIHENLLGGFNPRENYLRIDRHKWYNNIP